MEANAQPETGNCLPMKNMPLGTVIHNIEMTPGKSGQIRTKRWYQWLRLVAKGANVM